MPLLGNYLGFSDVGRYYVALGAFSDYAGADALLLLPMLFKRQFVRYQFGKGTGIDLYPGSFELYATGKKTK